jgi:hypothetical protein
VDTIPGLRETNARKRALVLESALNRQVLRVEFARIRVHTERVKQGYGWAQGAWKWAVPVAGFLLARKFKHTPGVVAKGSFVMTALGALWKVWQIARGKHTGPASRP